MSIAAVTIALATQVGNQAGPFATKIESIRDVVYRYVRKTSIGNKPNWDWSLVAYLLLSGGCLQDSWMKFVPQVGGEEEGREE